MSDCEHKFVNTKYEDCGKVKVTCSTCHTDVTKPHHTEIAKLYSK